MRWLFILGPLVLLAGCSPSSAPVVERPSPPAQTSIEPPVKDTEPAAEAVAEEPDELVAASAAQPDERHVTHEEFAQCVAAGACPALNSRRAKPLRVSQSAAFEYCRHAGKALPSAVLTVADLGPAKDTELGPPEWSRYRGPLWRNDWKRDSGVVKWEKEYKAEVFRTAQFPEAAYVLRCVEGASGPCSAHELEEPAAERLPFRCASGDVSRSQLRARIEERNRQMHERLDMPESLRAGPDGWLEEMLRKLKQEAKGSVLLDASADAR